VDEPASRTRLRDEMRAAAILAPGPLLFGISFGLLAPTSGMDGVPALAFSATTFAGSAQFAAVSVLGVGGSVAAAVVAAALLNARYAPMSVARSRVPRSMVAAPRRGAADRRRVVGDRRARRLPARDPARRRPVITVLCKAAGPVLLSTGRLSGRLLTVVELIGPVLLVALVVTQTFGAERAIVVDARLAGVAAALVALWLGRP
jgi:predicted branched-subunit amino acid permease